jgi:polysaccharide export outer membrane protein
MEGLIGVGDLLKVSVLGAPDYDQQVRVAGDGNASLALIGQVHVAGLTPQQAQDLIRQKLTEGSYFTDPQVSVFQLEFATQGVSVLGEVQRPGVYPILGPRRLFDALSLAGGTTLKAGDTVTITHRNSKESSTVKLSNDPAINEQANVQISPGDTIVVSKAGIVYVVGDVHQPSGVLMENGRITVLQAIAMAGGINPNAKLNSAKIIRRTPQGPIEVPLQLKQILAAKVPDVVLRQEDIVFIPNSAAKSATKNALENIVRVATGLAVYRVP